MDNDDEYARTTDFDMRSHVSGMSVWEVLQEPSRAADSSNKEWLSDLWKTSAMHRCTWWYGADYYSGQQTSGLLALVFSRSEGRSAKHHYPIQSHGLNQHMQVVNSWYQIQSRKDYSQLQLRPPPPRRLLAPKWTLVAMHCSTDNTHFSSIPKLEALPLHDLDNRLTQID